MNSSLFDPPEIPAAAKQYKVHNVKMLNGTTATPPLTGKPKRKRQRLWDEQKGLCAYCDTPLETPNHGTLDHVIPKSKGGSNNRENLKLVCPKCNALKGWFATLDEAQSFADQLVRFFENLKYRGIIQ